MTPCLLFALLQQREKVTLRLPIIVGCVSCVLGRRLNHRIERGQLDWPLGHEKKLNRVSDEFLFLRQPKVSFGSARFSSFLDASNVDQKRDEVFGEVYATRPSFIVHE